MHAELQITEMLAPDRQSDPVKAVAIAVGLLAVVLLVFARTTWSMVEIWHRSETFAHGFFVVPAFAWFVWQRREELSRLPIRPFWPALVGIIAVGFWWLLASLAETNSPAQFAVITLYPLTLLAILGASWVRTLLFPLAFLYFAVPFGEVFVPKLIAWTADFTVFALQLSGVPTLREGNSFVIPTGRWSVVETCSGVRYLIASLSVGTLYAWLMYRSALKRALFILTSIVVPIIANWMRAYVIVMIGHLSSNRLAVGIDHIIYGWVFFGLIMFVTFWIGARWRETEPEVLGRPPVSLVAGPMSAGGSRRRVAITTASALVALGLWPLADAALTRDSLPLTTRDLAITSQARWEGATDPSPPLLADLQNPTRVEVLKFSKGGHDVWLYAGLYSTQRGDAKLVTTVNLLAPPKAGWNIIESGRTQASVNRSTIDIRSATAIGPTGRFAVWQWYWLGGRRQTANGVVAKLDLAYARLVGAKEASAWLMIYTPQSESAEAAQRDLRRFAEEMGDSIDAALREAMR